MSHSKRASSTVVATAAVRPSIVVGIDVGDRWSRFCMLDPNSGEELRKGRIATTMSGLNRLLSRYRDARVAIEVGTHSPWMSRRIQELGHQLLVANSRKLRAIYQSDRKNDELDAQMLARLARVDPQLLSPIQHRGPQAQADLAVLRARDELVGCRTKLIGSVRGTVKAFGTRVRSCSAEAFHKVAAGALPDELKPALEPLLAQIKELTSRIRAYDKHIEAIALSYPAVERLQQVTGVGPVTSLCFVLTLEDPKRFKTSRSVGAYLGLCPRLDDSGEQSRQLRITKAGDPVLRALLVNCGHYILGPFGPDCDLR